MNPEENDELSLLRNKIGEFQTKKRLLYQEIGLLQGERIEKKEETRKKVKRIFETVLGSDEGSVVSMPLSSDDEQTVLWIFKENELLDSQIKSVEKLNKFLEKKLEELRLVINNEQEYEVHLMEKLIKSKERIRNLSNFLKSKERKYNYKLEIKIARLKGENLILKRKLTDYRQQTIQMLNNSFNPSENDLKAIINRLQDLLNKPPLIVPDKAVEQELAQSEEIICQLNELLEQKKKSDQDG